MAVGRNTATAVTLIWTVQMDDCLRNRICYVNSDDNFFLFLNQRAYPKPGRMVSMVKDIVVLYDNLEL